MKHTEEYPTWVPAKAVFAVVLTAVGVLLLGGCSGPRAGDAPTQPETTSRPDPTEQPETTQPEATQPEPEPEPACGDDVASVDDTVVTVCFVAFGDPSADGSGPHTLIEGVTIALLSTDGGLGGDRSVWWESVYAGAEEGSAFPLRPGQQLRSERESLAAAVNAVPSVVTGADGTARAEIQRREYYEYCAVHPGDAGLIAGCSEFDVHWCCRGVRSLKAGDTGYRTGYGGSGFGQLRLDESRFVYVYFSRGRAFLGVGRDWYQRFSGGDSRSGGTGNVTFTGDSLGIEPADGEVLVLWGEDRYGDLAVVKDEDIGEFWEAVRAIELSQADPQSAGAWAPATLLRTGADGTVRTELAAGDYLFCAVWNWEHGGGIIDCTYEDVTVGQDRVLNLTSGGGESEQLAFLSELPEQQSAQLLEFRATCEMPRCFTSEQWELLRQYYHQRLDETGRFPPPDFPPDDWNELLRRLSAESKGT